MNNTVKSIVFLALITILTLAACAPATTSTPEIPKTGASNPAPASNLSPVRQAQGELSTSQDAAWAKVVDAARKEGRVVIYSISMVGDIGIAVSNAFKEKYGISVDVITARGAAAVERLATEARSGQRAGDILESAPSHNIKLKQGNLSVSLLDLPVFQEKDAWQVNPLGNDPDGHVVGYVFKGLWPVINTKLVKPGEEPKSYKDFLLPQWKGKLIVNDPELSVCNYNVYYSLIDRKLLDESFLQALGKQELKYALGTKQIAEAVARGEFPLGGCAIENDMSPFIDAGAPIRPLVMEEANIFYTTTVTAVQNAPHLNASKLFLNWILSKEGQTVVTRPMQTPSVRKDVEDFRLPAMRQIPKRMVIMNQADDNRDAKLFADKVLVKMWKK